jgi:hypothetical protein
MADARSFLAQIDKAVDTVSGQPRSVPGSWHRR